MGRNTTWFLLAGVVLAALVPGEALKGTALVINKLKGKQADGSPLPTAAPVAESRSDVDVEPPTGEGDDAAGANATTKSLLTGIPQIDYVHDPNLPRELNGYNLTEYPFYDRVPEDIDFKCDGLHDGFYASIPHKCQVYHHCLFGTRYDFLCANYTAFDQKTFICHFVSEVDCANSPKYFKRNEALYKAATTTTTTTVAPSTTQPPPPPPPIRRPQATGSGATGPGGRRKRPYRRRRPVYDYYYDEDYEDDPDYYEDDLPGQQGGSAAAPPPPPPRRRRKRPRPQQRPQPVQEYEDQPEPVQDSAMVLPGDSKPRSSSSVYSRPRMPPKIRRPVPLNERDKYDYKKSGMADSAEDTRPAKSHSSTAAPPADDYYDDEEEYVPPARGTQQASKPRNPDYYPPPASSDREVPRRPAMTSAGRPPRRNRPKAPRRRPADTALPLEDTGDDYYDSYEQDPPPPPPPRRRPTNGRKRVPVGSARQEPEPYYRQPTRTQTEEDYPPPRKQAPTYSQRGGGRYEDEEEDLPVPAPRPAYISAVPANSGSVRQVHRKRVPPPEDDYEPYNRRPSSQGGRKQTNQRQPPPASYEDSVEYYDDDDVEEQPVQTSSRSRSKQQSVYRSPAPATAPPAPLPRSSPAPAVSKEVEDEEDIILPPSRAPSRPFLPSRGGSTTLPRGLQPLGAKAEPKSSSGYRTRIDDSQSPTAPEPLTSKTSKEGEAPKFPTDFRSGGGDITSARSKTQSGGDDLGARTSGKYKPSSARPEPAKNDDLSNAKTSPSLQQKPVKTPLQPIIKNDQPPPPPAKTNLADIDDYDVSLNDALHPTLQSTRSVATGIVSFPQLAPSRPQSFRTGSGRGGNNPLATAASQRQITRAPYEPEVGQTYLQPARKRQQQYSEVDLAPPPVQQQQYRVDGRPLSLGGSEEEQDDRLYVSPSRGYSRDY